MCHAPESGLGLVLGAGPSGMVSHGCVETRACPRLYIPIPTPRQVFPRATGLHSLLLKRARAFWGRVPFWGCSCFPLFSCNGASPQCPGFSLQPVCCPEGLRWALVGTQTDYSFLTRVLAPSLTLWMTRSRLGGRNKEPPGCGECKGIQGSGPSNIAVVSQARLEHKRLCDLNRHPLSLQKAAQPCQEGTR